MSGRSGNRKSHQPLLGRFAKPRVVRRAPEDMPDWRCSAFLPNDLAAFVATGPTHVLGVHIELGCLLVAEGKNLEWLQEQIAAFVASIARPGAEQTFTMVATREGQNVSFDVIITPSASVVIPRRFNKPAIARMK